MDRFDRIASKISIGVDMGNLKSRRSFKAAQCKLCGGDGVCPNCEGEAEKCKTCHGSGVCPSCHGKSKAAGSKEAAVTIEETVNLPNMTISEIASMISSDWKNVNYGAKPYLDAMYSLKNINDNYIMDSGKSIVAYFLSNARSYSGPVAAAIKKELNRRLKQ